jgi:AcrR family transcriptional regulator
VPPFANRAGKTAYAETPARPLRADARRNRERIMAAAREQFAARGRSAQMEDIATSAELGVGTLYRHFADKRALVTAMVQELFGTMTQLATDAEHIEDPYEALTTLIRSQSDLVAHDRGLQFALMSDDLEWEGIHEDFAELSTITNRIIRRGIDQHVVRRELTSDDVGMIMCGLASTMYFKPGGDWRRHQEILLDGLRA